MIVLNNIIISSGTLQILTNVHLWKMTVTGMHSVLTLKVVTCVPAMLDTWVKEEMEHVQVYTYKLTHRSRVVLMSRS